MTDGFKQMIGLLMFHRIPFEYRTCVYGQYLIGGHYDLNDASLIKWEVDNFPDGKTGIAFQPTALKCELDVTIAPEMAIRTIMSIEAMKNT